MSDVGTAMHAVGAGWLMTQMAPSPLIVALVQAATTLPMFLLLLPAGALGDILDRRRLLIFAQSWSVLGALALGLVTLAGWMSPVLLLLLTLALGIGAALAVPSFQSVVPELVPREQLPAAVSLSSMGVNIARAAGPAIAGVLIATLGVGAVFVFNAASFLFTIVVLWRWKRAAAANALPPEHFLSALRVGWRYAIHNPPLRAVLIRSAAFFSFAAALWALLPLVGAQRMPGRRERLRDPAELPRRRRGDRRAHPAQVRPKMSSDALSILSTALFALGTAAAALAENFYVVAAFMLPAGWAWLANLTTFNITARFSIAGWVMSRGLAINQMTFFGCQALGSIVWGQVASLTSIEARHARFRGRDDRRARRRAALPAGGARQGRSRAVAALGGADGAARGRERARSGPDDHRVRGRSGAGRRVPGGAAELKVARARNGGYGWGIYQDLENPGRYTEQFFTDSWLEHLRQHQRNTIGDKALQDRVRAFHRGAQPPKVSHLAAPAS